MEISKKTLADKFEKVKLGKVKVSLYYFVM